MYPLSKKYEHFKLQIDIKIVCSLKMFLDKNQNFHYFLVFFRPQSWLWESTAAIFLQSTGYRSIVEQNWKTWRLDCRFSLSGFRDKLVKKMQKVSNFLNRVRLFQSFLIAL